MEELRRRKERRSTDLLGSVRSRYRAGAGVMHAVEGARDERTVGPDRAPDRADPSRGRAWTVWTAEVGARVVGRGVDRDVHRLRQRQPTGGGATDRGPRRGRGPLRQRSLHHRDRDQLDRRVGRRDRLPGRARAGHRDDLRSRRYRRGQRRHLRRPLSLERRELQLSRGVLPPEGGREPEQRGHRVRDPKRRTAHAQRAEPGQRQRQPRSRQLAHPDLEVVRRRRRSDRLRRLLRRHASWRREEGDSA